MKEVKIQFAKEMEETSLLCIRVFPAENAQTRIPLEFHLQLFCSQILHDTKLHCVQSCSFEKLGKASFVSKKYIRTGNSLIVDVHLNIGKSCWQNFGTTGAFSIFFSRLQYRLLPHSIFVQPYWFFHYCNRDLQSNFLSKLTYCVSKERYGFKQLEPQTQRLFYWVKCKNLCS